jgi:hypothetical protein
MALKTTNCELANPGSAIVMTVTYSPTSQDCYYAINNTKMEASAAKSVTGCVPDDTTAEFIAESPLEGSSSHYATPDFGKPYFSNIQVQDGSTFWTVLDGPLLEFTQTVSTSGGSETLSPVGLIGSDQTLFAVMKTGA